MKYLFILLFALSASAKELPSGDWDAMYKEIHGDGVYNTAEKSKASSRAMAIVRDMEDVEGMADRANLALRSIYRVAVRNLKLYGFHDEARKLQSEWGFWDGRLQEFVGRSLWVSDYRDIGDFPGLIAWIDKSYDILEFTLGYKLCFTLRLTDIKTINRALGLLIRVKMCTAGNTQTMAHLCGDLHTNPLCPMPYRGLVPVTSYWVSNAACSFATFGAGIFWICSPLSYLVELTVDKWLCEPAVNKVYDWVCN